MPGVFFEGLTSSEGHPILRIEMIVMRRGELEESG